MQLCTFCESPLPDGVNVCQYCGNSIDVTPGNVINGERSSSSSVSWPWLPVYPAAEEHTSHLSSTIPAPLYTDDGNLLAPFTYTPVPPTAIYADTSDSSTVLAHADVKEFSSLNEQAPPPPVYPHVHSLSPYRESASNESEWPAYPLPPKSIAARPRRGLVRWVLVALVCLLVLSGTIGAFQITFHLQGSSKSTGNVQAGKLNVKPDILDFGTIQAGSKVILAVLVANSGKDSLTWSVDTGDTPWLKAVSNTEKIDPGGPEQLIYTIADTGNLAAGNHAGVEHIHSNAGDADIPIKVDVSPPNGKKQARLNVNPSILNLGTLSANRQVTTLVTVGNTGNQDLNWKANTGNTSWLALNQSSGRVQAGGFPQTITVTVKTAHLASGSYSTLLNITSNGGNFQVGVTLVVQSSTPSNTLTVSPSNFSNGCLSCIVTLSSPTSSRGNVNWQSASTGISGIKFSPSRGTLSAGRTTQVTVSVPNIACPASAVLSFSGSESNASVLWSCTPTPTHSPMLAVSPSSFSNGCSSCVVTLSPAAGSQSNLNWYASSAGINGVSFSPSSGTLKPGQVIHVTVSVPPQNCPASSTFNFKGQANTSSVSWSCSAKPPPTTTPTFTVSPDSLNAGSGNCSQNGDHIYTCTVSVAETSQGDLNWSANSNIGGNINPSSGQLSAGQSQQSVTISSIPCQDGSFTFTGQGSNTITVPWSCTPPQPPATISVSPASLSPTSGNCSVNGDSTYTCSVNVSEASSGNVNWSGSTSVGGTISPANGQLSAEQSQQPVTISSIPCQDGSFTFTGQGSNTITVPWSCTPPQPPIIGVSPNTFTDGCVYCTVTLTSTGSSSDLNWSASSSLSGVTFSPSSGTISPGQSVQVGISPYQTCPASGTFSFTGPANTAVVSWECSGSNLTVGPTNFNPSGCSSDSNGNWQCIVILTSDPNNQGSLNWNASISGGSGISLSQSSGTLYPAGDAQIVVTIPQSNCPGSGQISFTGPTNVATAAWSC